MFNLEWHNEKLSGFDRIPENSGVYVISTKQKCDGKYEAKYVGQADDLRKRANEHWSDSEANEELKNHISKGDNMKYSYAKVSSSSDRDGLELYLYNFYNPIYNKNKPPGDKEIKCNLPNVRYR